MGYSNFFQKNKIPVTVHLLRGFYLLEFAVILYKLRAWDDLYKDSCWLVLLHL